MVPLLYDVFFYIGLIADWYTGQLLGYLSKRKTLGVLNVFLRDRGSQQHGQFDNQLHPRETLTSLQGLPRS